MLNAIYFHNILHILGLLVDFCQVLIADLGVLGIPTFL